MYLLEIALVSVFFAMIFFVVFGQITVRKLRKNPETREALGLEFDSGWDILNTAGALALPRYFNRLLRSTPLAFLYADADLLDKHTNLFDRVLAAVFYSFWVVAGVSGILLAILHFLGFAT